MAKNKNKDDAAAKSKAAWKSKEMQLAQAVMVRGNPVPSVSNLNAIVRGVR